MKKWKRWLLVLCIIGVIAYAYWKFAIPTHRIEIHSELVMLGDLDNDNRWTAGDLKLLDAFLDDPFADSGDVAWRHDLNRNGLIDKEDLVIIRALIDSDGNPYVAGDKARSKGIFFPLPRELYRYISDEEYRIRPLWALPYPLARFRSWWLFVSLPPTNVTFMRASSTRLSIQSCPSIRPGGSVNKVRDLELTTLTETPCFEQA
jgi:hypothetical protein